MKSTTGTYYIGLDHIRAIAAFLVFNWHFDMAAGLNYAPPPVFPLSTFTEGHHGVYQTHLVWHLCALAAKWRLVYNGRVSFLFDAACPAFFNQDVEIFISLGFVDCAAFTHASLSAVGRNSDTVLLDYHR